MPFKTICKHPLTLSFFLLLLCNIANGAVEHPYGKFSFFVDHSVPDWLAKVKPAKAKGKKKGQNTEYLLVDTQVLADANNYESYYRTTSKLHTSQAVADGSEIHAQFNPEYQALYFHYINIVRNGKTINALQPEAVRLIQREEDLRNGIFDGQVTAIAIVADTRPGDILDYSYTVKGRNPIFGEKVFGAYSAGWGVDVARLHIRILVPKELRIQTREHHTDIKKKLKKKGKYLEHVWQAKNVQGIIDEGDYPLWYLRYGWVEFSEYKNWQEVDQWAASMYASIEQESSAVDTLVKTLLEDSHSIENYVLNALNFVQEDIRYLGLEIGQNSHLPHAPTEVLEKRYGDCKDKSNLLVKILRANNIKANSVLVASNYRHGFKKFLPSPSAFNHVIVRAEVDRNIVWLDPTKTFQAGGLYELGFTHYGAGLVIESDKETPIENILPINKEENSIYIKEHFIAKNTSKPTTLNIESRYQGSSAEDQRYRFSASTPEDIQLRRHNYFAKLYPKIAVKKSIEFQDDKNTNTFTVRESYTIPDFIKPDEDSFSANFYARGIGMSLYVPEQILRTTPVDIGEPRVVNHDILFDMPKNSGLYIDSTPYKHTQDGFHFSSRSAKVSNRFEYKAKLKIDQTWVEGKGITRYIDAIDFIEKDIDFSLTFAHPYEPTMSPAYQKLLKSLEN
ncbi:Transglutaminase-like enzymes, putative cysteine proteases [Alteromonadaceae bacterium Bs31]|nr:Transglutaminase-like enzymes, putative cysteine proteases [Alteromonadaceae bacterium Bs31]